MLEAVAKWYTDMLTDIKYVKIQSASSHLFKNCWCFSFLSEGFMHAYPSFCLPDPAYIQSAFQKKFSPVTGSSISGIPGDPKCTDMLLLIKDPLHLSICNSDYDFFFPFWFTGNFKRFIGIAVRKVDTQVLSYSCRLYFKFV